MADADAERTGDLDRLIASAANLGIELDQAEALQWLTAMAAARTRSERACA